MAKTVAERFWEKVDKADGCWEWTAYKDARGYGSFNLNGRPIRAHQYSYQEAYGPVPQGLEIDHRCRNTGCVKPTHLEAVTHQENISRGNAGINSRMKTHCPQGHPYDGPGGRVNSVGSRYCLICARQRWHSRKLRFV